MSIPLCSLSGQSLLICCLLSGRYPLRVLGLLLESSMLGVRIHEGVWRLGRRSCHRLKRNKREQMRSRSKVDGRSRQYHPESIKGRRVRKESSMSSTLMIQTQGEVEGCDVNSRPA